MMKKKRKWIFWLVLFILSIAFTVLWWVVIQFYRDYQNIPTHHLIGNRPSTVAALKEQGMPFSFLVIGDTYCSENAETLIELAMKMGNPSFMVILGDFVSKPDIWNHRFFLTEMAAEMKPPFPIFLVAGNHDIDFNSSKIKRKGRSVTPEIYESLYGSMNFDFIFSDCLFIICGIDLKKPNHYLNYLRDALSKKGEGKKYIFVFVHYPPKGLAEHIEGSLPIPNEEDFFSILEAYKVSTCFFGDYHGYWRGQRKGVNLIVSGGGGRLKKSQPEWGKFHHIMRINVEQDKVSEEIITIRGEIELEDWFERWVFMNLFPFIQNSVWILYLIFIILLMMSGYIFIRFLKTIR